MTRLRLRRYDRNDRGVTLMETVVGLGIFGLLLALLSGVVVQIIRGDSGTRIRLANLDQVRTGMDAMTRTLRTAVRPEQLNGTCSAACDYAFETIGDSTVVFTANLGAVKAGAPAPTRVTYTVAVDPDDASGATAAVTEVRQQVASTWTSGDYAFAGGPGACAVGGPIVAGCSARVVTSGLRWPLPDGHAFVYRALGQTAGLSTVAGGSETVRRAVSTVEVTLPVGSADAATSSVTSRVFLPNSSLGR